jgi:small subunit ribosomal protein S17
MRRSAKFMAHDEKNQCNVGDTVEIVETRPLSLRKRWRVRKIVRSALGTETPQAAQG